MAEAKKRDCSTSTLIAPRSDINLFYRNDKGRGFFVEVGTDADWGQAVVLCSFVSSGLLEEYAHEVRLPE
jgi:hypothetical protein